jgi:hypothetical protein
VCLPLPSTRRDAGHEMPDLLADVVRQPVCLRRDLHRDAPHPSRGTSTGTSTNAA